MADPTDPFSEEETTKLEVDHFEREYMKRARIAFTEVGYSADTEAAALNSIIGRAMQAMDDGEDGGTALMRLLAEFQAAIRRLER